jgi:hypothetical protein
MVQFRGNKLQDGGRPPETQAPEQGIARATGRASASCYFGKALVFGTNPLLFVFGNENTTFQSEPGGGALESLLRLAAETKITTRGISARSVAPKTILRFISLQ